VPISQSMADVPFGGNHHRIKYSANDDVDVLIRCFPGGVALWAILGLRLVTILFRCSKTVLCILVLQQIGASSFGKHSRVIM
jgi:hypothetical protein